MNFKEYKPYVQMNMPEKLCKRFRFGRQDMPTDSDIHRSELKKLTDDINLKTRLEKYGEDGFERFVELQKNYYKK